MSEKIDSRALMLEQLESRCLLAGGIFSFSDANEDHRDRDHVRQYDHDRSRNDRGAQVRSHEHNAHRRTRDEFRSFERSSHRGQQSIQIGRRFEPVVTPSALPTQVTPNQLPSTQNTRIGQGEPLETHLGTNNNQIADSPSAVLFVIIRQDDLRPQTDDGIFASRGDVAQNDSSESGSTRQPTTQRSNPAPASRSVATSADTQVLASTSNAAQASEIVESDTERAARSPNIDAVEAGDNASNATTHLPSTTNESIRGLGTVTFLPNNHMKQEGMIESLPIIRDKPIARQSADEPEPWKLNRETLEQLREISSHPTENDPLERGAPTDAVIASWFSGPGGLIELGGTTDVEAQRAPLLIGEALPDDVRIAQDALFGLHRTLDLVANAESQASNETIRDVILAAVAGEQDRTASPIHDPAVTGMSAFAYPGAALIASTLAIAGGRRHANAMIATQKDHLRTTS